MGGESLERKRTFDTAARLYDEVRPGYPEDLVRDVVSLSGIPQGGRILEIGCGTGQATEAFAARGYRMVCLDIGVNMAAIAGERLSRFENVRIVVKPFEEWQADGMAFDLVIAATSFHWIDPAVRYCKSAEVLGPCGALAIIHNNHIRQDEGFFAEVEPLYRQYYGPAKPLPPAEHTGTPQPEPGEECFEPPIRRNHLWSREYDAERYIRAAGDVFGPHPATGGAARCVVRGDSGVDQRPLRRQGGQAPGGDAGDPASWPGSGPGRW